MLLVGASNNGKSTIAEKFLRQHPRRTSAEGDRQIVSALLVQMPPMRLSGASMRFFWTVSVPRLGKPGLPTDVALSHAN